MAESTLTAAFQDLQADVGFYLGFGRGVNFKQPAWDDFQQASIDRCVKGGLRRFYFNGHPWSFLKPTASLDLPVNTQKIPLPDDFGGFEGRVTLFSTTSLQWWPIELTSEGRIRAEYSIVPSATGRPLLAGLSFLKGTTGTQGQRCQLVIFPQSDADYTLQFSYYILPDYLTGAFPFAYGGAAHAETLLAACKATAELDLDDMQGPQEQKFQELLQRSIEWDQKSKPQSLGYNGDMSDIRYRTVRPDQHGYSTILVGGQQY